MRTPASNKIAVFVPSMHGGGAERAMLMFCAELVRRGYSVDLLTTRFEGPLRGLVPRGVSVVDLQSRRTSLTLIQLVRYLRQTRPAALYSTIMNANIVAALAGKMAGCETKTILRESNAPLSSPKNSLSRWTTFKLSPYLYRLSDGVIAVSRGVADELTEMAPRLTDKIRVISTPAISDDVIAQGTERVEHPWFVQRDKPIILSAARLEPHKGFLSLVRAFVKVRKERDARLVLLGEGTLQARIEQEVKDLGLGEHVAMLGWVKNPYAYLSKADVFVLASEFEGLPNVLIQAMAFGTPIVATDCKSGPAEILAGGRFGTLVPVRDEEALARGLLHALNMPRQLEAMAHARATYGAQRAVDAYLAMAGLCA